MGLRDAVLQLVKSQWIMGMAPAGHVPFHRIPYLRRIFFKGFSMERDQR